MGYLLQALKLRRAFESGDLPKCDILSGHSYGGAVVAVYSTLFGKYHNEFISIAPPPSHGWLNPFRSKKLTVFYKPDDYIYGTHFLLPYRQPKKIKWLP